jgi:hypothetical protein
VRLATVLSDDEGTRLEIAVRRTAAGESVTAIEDRGISFFVADSDEQLADVVGTYLAGHGFLRFADEIDVSPEKAPRADRLDADTIWTHGDDFGIAANESEEALA